MSFRYSGFISYRRNEGDTRFLKNFKKIIESEAQRVTNITKVFFDEDSIDWGKEFDHKVYEGIIASYFFIPIYQFSYLHVDNVWCARELYHALEVEKVIRNKIGDKSYCYILPILFRGQLDSLPDCISKKKVKSIRQLEAIIESNRVNTRLTEFKNYVYDTFFLSFKLLSAQHINLKEINELCAQIIIPTDEKIKEWIEYQKGKVRLSESNKLPILRKNAE